MKSASLEILVSCTTLVMEDVWKWDGGRSVWILFYFMPSWLWHPTFWTRSYKHLVCSMQKGTSLTCLMDCCHSGEFLFGIMCYSIQLSCYYSSSFISCISHSSPMKELFWIYRTTLLLMGNRLKWNHRRISLFSSCWHWEKLSVRLVSKDCVICEMMTNVKGPWLHSQEEIDLWKAETWLWNNKTWRWS